MAQSVRSTWQSPGGPIFEMQHRSEDQVLIQDVLREHRPGCAVELGTAGGGFTALLAETVGAWRGWVTSFDKVLDPSVRARLLATYQNLLLEEVDVLVPGGAPLVLRELAQGGAAGLCLYCDNGDKPQELRLYAPLLPSGSLLGCHDYATEVDPAWVEPFLAGLGYQPHRQAEFAALAHPTDYPQSLTRFWVRG